MWTIVRGSSILVHVLSVIVPSVVGSVTAQNDAAGSVFGGMICMFWLAVIGAVFYYFWSQRTPFQLTTQTGLAPQDAIRTAVQTFTMSGWQITSQTHDNATFAKNRKPSCLLAGILLLIGFIPGILYLVLAGGTMNAYVHAATGGTSTTTLQISGTASGWGAKSSAQRVVQAARAPQGIGGAGQQMSLPPQ